MKTKSLKSNFIFQTAYKIIVVIVPLLIAPYLTRRLGGEPLGIYSFTNSIAYYFVLLAGLGIAKYGQRVISYQRDDDLLLRKTFWSLYYDQLFFSIISSTLYVFFIVFFAKDYSSFYWIQLVYVVSSLFDITWLYYGLESFKSVVIKNCLVKILECTFIFIFVKSSSDLWVYTLIMSSSVFLGQAILLPRAIKEIKPIKIGIKDLTEHIKPLFLLFISVVASTLYTVFDKTLLGIFSIKENVAYYEYACKFVNIPKQLLAVIGTVLFPRACHAFAEKKFELQERYLDLSIFLTCLFGFAFMFGVMAVGRKFAVIYFGEEFRECGNAIVCLSPLIIIVMIGDVVRSEYLIPVGKDKTFVFSIVISAVVNIVLSVILIPYLGIYGAVIGTLTAEMIGTTIQVIVCLKFYSFRKMIANSLVFALLGVSMFLIVYLIDINTNESILWLLLEIFIGFVVYTSLSIGAIALLFKDKKNEFLKLFQRKA